MDADRVVRLEDLAGLTPDQVMALLDPAWSGLLAPIGEYLEQLWNAILSWLWDAVGWVYDRIKPLIDTVWDWLSSWAQWLYTNVSALFTQVWSWIQGIVTPIVAGVSALFAQVWSWLQSTAAQITMALSSFSLQIWDWIQTVSATLCQILISQFNIISQSLQSLGTFVAAKVSEINAWFSNEFIDPFLDWLVQFPGKFWQVLKDWWAGYWPELVRQVHDPKSPLWITWYSLIGIAIVAVIGMATPIGAAVVGAVRWIGGTITTLWPAIGGWLASFFSDLGIWIGLYAGQLGGWALKLLPRLAGWFTSNIITLLGSGTILGLAGTGKLEAIVDRFVTPAIVSVFDHFEALGPVSPVSGTGMSTSIGKLATFTVAGLAGMTLAGEMLSPLKQIGLGNISAIIYDLINYKTLTAAFMGVLAVCYIKTPLTYYYNKAARPYIPNVAALTKLVGEYVITDGEFAEGMAYQGYPDNWIPKLRHLGDTPLAPRMLNYLATVGITDDALIDRELHHAGYDARTIPYIKTWLQRSASADAKAMSTSTALARYREGMDDDKALADNLSALGVADNQLDRYAFVAQLMYTYDYQHDLIAFWIDAYHRRDIEEPELRTSLVQAGLSPERLELVVAAQKIKRLTAAKPTVNPAIAVNEATIRARRDKDLITREQEIEQLVTLGDEVDYATALADQDDVKLTPSGKPVAAVALLAYETEAGKIQVDTIRRERRSRAIADTDELAALLALAMPSTLAQAIVDNDSLRLTKASATG